jgi:hypothetical protein
MESTVLDGETSVMFYLRIDDISMCASLLHGVSLDHTCLMAKGIW